MADGKIEYELSIDARQALTNVQSVTSATDKLASSAKDAAKAAGQVGGAFSNISTDKLKMAAMMLAGMATDAAAVGLEIAGKDRPAAYVRSIGKSAAIGAGTGALVGSVVPGIGTAVGSAAGAAIGAGSGAINQFGAFYKEDKKKLEDTRDSLAQVSIAGMAARRALAEIKTPDQLNQQIGQLKDKLIVLQQSAKAGLIDENTYTSNLVQLRRSIAYAESLVPGATEAEAEKKRKKDAEDAIKSAPDFSSRASDSLTAMGAILAGGGASGVNDHARSTAQNTARMVTLLERLGTQNGQGGARWQP
jgi:uncharacterized membrane protein